MMRRLTMVLLCGMLGGCSVLRPLNKFLPGYGRIPADDPGIHKANELKVGMSMEEVKQTIGAPILTEFRDRKMVYEYKMRRNGVDAPFYVVFDENAALESSFLDRQSYENAQQRRALIRSTPNNSITIQSEPSKPKRSNCHTDRFGYTTCQEY